MGKILYYFLKFYIKTGLFFYSKKIKVSGIENIPKKEAILFTANHPNGLLDPLLIATHIKQKTHFLVRAAVFKKKLAANFFNLLGMMPIYRIRDGINQLAKNEEIFNKCQELLNDKKALLIFPEGSHCKDRTIRTLSKGFTRIIFRTLNESPNTIIHIVPIGITYQNSSKYPSKVALNFGKPIVANNFYDANNIHQSAKTLKELVSNQLKQLSVHIDKDENYSKIIEKLNNAQIDFTNVRTTNSIIANKKFPLKRKTSFNYTFLLKELFIINSLFPFLIWKFLSRKITEIEFVDTFRFGVNIITVPLFYFLQTLVIYLLFDINISLVYLLTSFLLALTYVKTSFTQLIK